MRSHKRSKLKTKIRSSENNTLENKNIIKYEFYTLKYDDSGMVSKVAIINNVVHLFVSRYDLSWELGESGNVIITKQNQQEWSEYYREDTNMDELIPLDEYIGSWYSTKIFKGVNSIQDAKDLINKLGKRYSFVIEGRENESLDAGHTLLLEINQKENIYLFITTGCFRNRKYPDCGWYFFKAQSPIIYFSALTTNWSTHRTPFPLAIDINGNIYELEAQSIFLYKDASEVITYWYSLDQYNQDIKRKNINCLSSYTNYLKIKDKNDSLFEKIFNTGYIKLETLNDVLKHNKDIIENNKKVIAAFNNGYVGEINITKYNEIYNELIDKLGKKVPIDIIESPPKEDELTELKKIVYTLQNTPNDWSKARAVNLRKTLEFILRKPRLKKKYKNLLKQIEEELSKLEK